MIDSHTHLDRGPAPRPSSSPARARGRASRGSSPSGWTPSPAARRSPAADAHPEVFAAVGRHPNTATGFDDAAPPSCAELAAHPRCRAIGETGLDYYRDYAPRDDQERAFAAHIELARETGQAAGHPHARGRGRHDRDAGARRGRASR